MTQDVSRRVLNLGDTARAMSQENPEVVRRSIELWNEGDLAAFVALHHPDVVVVPPDNWPDGEVTRGRKPGFVRA